jgi:hypothetical protein
MDTSRAARFHALANDTFNPRTCSLSAFPLGHVDRPAEAHFAGPRFSAAVAGAAKCRNKQVVAPEPILPSSLDQTDAFLPGVNRTVGLDRGVHAYCQLHNCDPMPKAT